MSSRDKDAVEIRRWWYRLRVDERGVHIGRKPPIPWDQVRAVGVDYRWLPVLASLVPVAQWGSLVFWLARPCLHVCVRGDEYPRAVPALRFSRLSHRQARESEADRARVQQALGEWTERIPVVCPAGDLNQWWMGNGGQWLKIPIRRVDKPPSTHERAADIHHQLGDLQRELEQIERRKRHGLDP